MDRKKLSLRIESNNDSVCNSNSSFFIYFFFLSNNSKILAKAKKAIATHIAIVSGLKIWTRDIPIEIPIQSVLIVIIELVFSLA